MMNHFTQNAAAAGVKSITYLKNYGYYTNYRTVIITKPRLFLCTMHLAL